MKAKALLFCVLLAAITFAAQDTFRVTRTVKEGDKSTYKLHMTGSMAQGDIDTQMTFVETVKKVYDNGEADIERAVPDASITLNGSEIPGAADGAKTTTVVHVDKDGNPVKQPEGAPKRMEYDRAFTAFYGKDLKVGDNLPVDWTDPKDDKTTVKGSVKVDSLANGIAKFVADLKVTSSESDTPSHIVANVSLDTTTARPEKAEGTIDSLPIGPTFALTDVKFTMERVKA